MVEVKRNTPPPVEQPPDTYDILGLSRYQAALIRDLLGHVDSDDNTYPVFHALLSAVPGQTQDFQFKADDSSRPLCLLKAWPLG